MSERIVVTGAAGFIGSNIIRGLNDRGITDIIAVDNLSNGDKFKNLDDLQISDYYDKNNFYEQFSEGRFGRVEAVFHEGACSDTMEHDGRYMLENNYRTSRILLDTCQDRGTRLLYASSAATYGAGAIFIEKPMYERPLNVYGYSKLLFDQVVRQVLPDTKTQIAGFRYFNVYGPREQHKGRMASVAYHHFHQYRAERKVKLFGEYGGYGPGQQERDFIWVKDAVAVNLWFYDNPNAKGIYNLGSGRAQSFNDVSRSVVNALRAHEGLRLLSLEELVSTGEIEYIPFPEALVGRYQCHTQADLTRLREVGCIHEFSTVEDGVREYVSYLLSQGDG